MIKLCAFADESSGKLSGQIEALVRNNIPYLEIRGVDGKNVADLSEEEARAIYEKLSENGLAVWSIGSPLGKVNVDVDFDEYLKKVEHVCKIANILQAKQIRCFSFFKAYNDREKVLEYMQKMVDVGSKYGVFMCHENEKDIYGDTLERTVDILDNVKGIKCVYDPANFLQVGESDSNKTLDALHSRAHYFHIKDVISATGELVPAGEGDGNIDKLVANIKDDKVLTLEPHLAIFDSYKSIDDTEMKNKYVFSSNEEAFDCAVNSLKKILIKNGYKEIKGAFVK
ncbi:MAG: sugar phosphate isomerase/epimerase [Clostridiales bacterium]|nr:sugar phosphate isomerase/epimerase [Clostridiales bacterium]